jgi:biopolymer transport protein ExbD
MSSDGVKGFHGRIVSSPGYHIHPQYDLVHTRHLIEHRRKKKSTFTLNLAPMVDMFSILVIYLIMNFSTEGQVFFVSKDIKIPKASRGQPLKSFPLVSIVKDTVIFDMENPGSQPLFVTEPNDEKVPQLREMLRKVKALQQQITSQEKVTHQLNLQADEGTSVQDVKKVLRVLIDEGWTGINFIVDPASQANK